MSGQMRLVKPCASCHGSGYQEHGWGRAYHLEPCRSCKPRAGADADSGPAFQGYQSTPAPSRLSTFILFAVLVAVIVILGIIADSIGPLQ